MNKTKFVGNPHDVKSVVSLRRPDPAVKIDGSLPKLASSSFVDLGDKVVAVGNLEAFKGVALSLMAEILMLERKTPMMSRIASDLDISLFNVNNILRGRGHSLKTNELIGLIAYLSEMPMIGNPPVGLIDNCHSKLIEIVRRDLGIMVLN